ncbi:MAG: hypothetical protein ACKN9V_06890, partial [Pseudomonadota bacterium]
EINEYYMVTGALWSRAGMNPTSGMLCIGCLENRVGHELKSSHFKECPLNWRNVLYPGMASKRLLSRYVNGGPRSKWKAGTKRCLTQILKNNNWALLAKLTLTEHLYEKKGIKYIPKEEQDGDN